MLFGSVVPAAFLSVPVPEVPVAFPSVSDVPSAFPSVSGSANKFIANKFLAADELISVPALPCVFGADCEVGAASVELLAGVLLLALPC